MRLKEVKGVVLLWGLPSDNGLADIKSKAQTARDLHVLVPEMRPHCFGLEIAKRLRKEGIKHTYATDNMLGILFYKEKVKEVRFFYKDIIGPHAVGICGSLYTCLLAHLHGVPIRPVRGDSVIRSAQKALLLDEYVRVQYNEELTTEDEYVPLDILA